MKKNIKFAAGILILFMLFSCIKPPKGTNEINVTNLFKNIFDELNRDKDRPEEQLKFFEDIQTNFQAVISYFRDTTVYVSTSEAVPGPEDFAHTLKNNRIITDRTLYVTMEGRNMLFSFDNKTWYLDKSDPVTRIEGVQKDYHFDTRIEGNDFFVNYRMSFSLGRAPKIVDISRKRKEIISLKKGMVFASFDEKK